MKIRSIFFYIALVYLLFVYENKCFAIDLSDNWNNEKKTIVEVPLSYFPDSLMEIRLSGISHSVYYGITNSSIPLYSLFDGSYNYNFIKQNIDINLAKLNKNTTDSINLNKDSIISKILLYSGNKDGLLEGVSKGNIKNYFWSFTPVFESSGGYYYSNKKTANYTDLIFLENSAYQNIAFNVEGGIRNNKSSISLSALINISNLYVPINLNNLSPIKQHFSDYDEFIEMLKFENYFNENLKFEGNIFVKKFLRNFGSNIDTNSFPITGYISSTQIDEYSYGGNLSILTPLFIKQKDFKLTFNYSQDVFLYSYIVKKWKLRAESEELFIKASQAVPLTDFLSLNLSVELQQRAIIYSEFGKIPANNSNYNLDISSNYKLSDAQSFSVRLMKFAFVPFVSQYYDLNGTQQGNINLDPENWLETDLRSNTNISNIGNIQAGIIFSTGNNVLYPSPSDSGKFTYLSAGLVKAVNLYCNFEIYWFNFKLANLFSFALLNTNNSEIQLEPTYRVPKLADAFTMDYQFDFGLDLQLQANYNSGIRIFNQQESAIEYTKKSIIFNFQAQQKFSNQYFYINLKNLTNEYYEYNYGIPEAGLNFQIGIILSF